MTSRKIKGIGMLVSGGAFLIVGALFMATETTPDWLPILLQGIGLIANLLGFKVVFPDKEKDE